MDDRKEFRRQEQQARWETLVELLKIKYPDILRVKERRDWDRFRAIHPEIPLDGNVFFDYALTVKEREKEHKETGRSFSSPPSHTGGHGASPFDPAYVLLSMFLHPKAEIIEQDKKYQKIENGLKEEWKKKNPALDFDSKEGLDYLYGSLEEPEAPTLAKDAEKKFRELHPKEAAKYDKKKSKVYKNTADDPVVKHTRAKIEAHAQKRFVLAKKADPAVKIENIRQQVEEKHWRDFALTYQEKAVSYAQHHEGIRRAVETVKKTGIEKQETQEKKEIREQVAQYAATVKKDIRVVEDKLHRSPPSEEATRRLEEAAIKGGLQPPASLPSPVIPSQTIIKPEPLTPISKPTLYQPSTPSLIVPQKPVAPPITLVTQQEQPLVSTPPPRTASPKQQPPQPAAQQPAEPIIPTSTITETPVLTSLTQPTVPAQIVSAPIPPPVQQPTPRPSMSPQKQPRQATQIPQQNLNILARLLRQQVNMPPPQTVSSPMQLPQSQSTPQPPSTPSIPRPHPRLPRPPRPAPAVSGTAQLGRLGRLARAARLFSLAINPWMIALIAGVIIFLLFLVFFLALSGGGAAILPGSGETTSGGTSPGMAATGAGCPTQEQLKQNSQDRNTCRFLNPSINIFDTTISQEAIEFYVNKYSPTFIRAGKGDVVAFRERVTYIVNRAKEAGLNPTIFLGYWKTESAFSTVGSRDMGCVGNGFYEQVDCAVGLRGSSSFRGALCARSGNADSPSCRELKGIRSNPIYSNYPISYPIKTFDDFAETYGPISPNLEGPGKVNNNCISTYNKLVETAIELQACKATPIASSQGLTTVLQWTQKINDALQPGLPPSSYNRMLADISNGSYAATKRQALDRGVSSTGIYWCTNIAIDSYNLAGAKGLGPNHQGVRGMLDFWKKTPGYIFIPYAGIESLRQVKPGQAFFRINPPDYNYDHVSIVKSITVNESGNGTIETLDSNSSKSWDSTIANGRIVETYFLSRIVGFGSLEQQVDNLQTILVGLPPTSTAVVITPDGKRTETNGTQQVPSASTVKLWVAAATYDASQNGTINLSETYTIKQGDIAPGTGVLHQQVGSSKTYAELIDLMLVYSDNSATNLLIDKLGGFAAINDYIARNGYASTRLQRKLGYQDSTRENYTSANDAATFMQNLYSFKIVNQNASSAIINILQRRRQYENKAYDYIGRYLPSGVDYVEKSGLGTRVRNDVGSFVTKSGGRVFVAIFLSNSNEQTQEEAIGKTVQQLYNSIP